MAKTLTVNFAASQQEYTFDGMEFDKVYLNGITKVNFDSGDTTNRFQIVDDYSGAKKLRIRVNTDGAGAYKYINILNFQEITTVQTDTATPGVKQDYDLTRLAALSNMTNPILNPKSGNNYEGTIHSDLIDASLASPLTRTERYKVKNKWKTRTVATSTGVNINAGTGDDNIVGSNYNDIITGGAGENTIYLNNTTPFGNDTYNMTAGESLEFRMTAAGPQPEFTKSGQNLVINVSNEAGAAMGTMTVIDFFTEDVTTSFHVKSSDGATWDINVKTDVDFSAYTDVDLEGQNGTFIGTYMDDTFDAENAAELVIAKKVKKGRKTVTVYQHTGTSVNISSGLGDDTIISSQWADTFNNGLGSDTIVFKDNFGNDTVNLTAQQSVADKLTLDFTNIAGITSANDFTFTVEGADLVVHAKDSGTVRLTGYARTYIEGVNIKYNGGNFSIDDGTINARLTSVAYQGSRFSDNINATAAPQVMKRVKVKGKWKNVATGIGVTINAAEADDVIRGSAYNDTLTGGSGNNTVYLNTDAAIGDDTYYRSDGDNVTFKLEGTQGTCTATQSGQNLVITVYGDDGKTIRRGSVTVVDYYKTDLGNVVVKDLANANVEIPQGIDIMPMGFGGTFDGTRFNDTIDASALGPVYETIYKKIGKKRVPVGSRPTDIGATIRTYDGNDTITGTIYKDTITGGSGTNIIKLNLDEDGFNEDTIYLTEGEKLKFQYDDGDSIGVLGSYEKHLVGNDLVVTVYGDGDVRGKVIIKDFGQHNPAALIRIYAQGDDINDDNAGEDLTDITASEIVAPNAAGTYGGTRLNDTFDFRNVAEEKVYVTKKKKKVLVGTGRGVTVNTGDGNDTITGSRYNDTITGGSGTNRILVDVRNNFGTDTINLTDGETLEIQFLGGENDTPGFDNLVYNFEPTGRDFIIIVYGEHLEYDAGGELITAGHTPKGTLILKDYFVKNVTLVGLDKNGAELKDDQEKTLAFTAHREYQNAISNYATFSGGNTYNASRFDDIIDASGAGQYIKTVTTTKKVKGKTVKTTTKTPTGIGVTIDSGAGNDTITGSDWNDTLYSGEGNDKITGGKGNDSIYAGAGDDEIVFTAGDGVDVLYAGGGDDTLTFNNIAESTDFDSQLSLATNGSDLIIQYSDSDRVFLNDYFTAGHSVSEIKAADGSHVNLQTFLNSYLATRGGKLDTFISGNSGDDSYHFEFPEHDTIGIMDSGSVLGDMLEMNYSNADTNVFFHVNGNGNIGNLYLTCDALGNTVPATGIQIADFGGAGKIETIKDSAGWTLSNASVEAVRAEIAGWISTNGLVNTQTILASGDDANIATLMAYYAGVNWNPPA